MSTAGRWILAIVITVVVLQPAVAAEIGITPVDRILTFLLIRFGVGIATAEWYWTRR